MERIRIAAVSYSNTLPFLLGIRERLPADSYSLSLHVPSACAGELAAGRADIGLIPVAAIPSIPGARVVSDYCIGADGPVETVCLFSECPLSEAQTILLDHESRTSVRLMRLLAEEHFRIRPRWEHAEEGFINRIGGRTAGVVIGDRAFPLHRRFPVVIDLAEEWKRHTGLPFAFACWVAVRPLPEGFIALFNAALTHGVAARARAVAGRPDSERLMRYVTEHISYPLDAPKREAIGRFLRWQGDEAASAGISGNTTLGR